LIKIVGSELGLNVFQNPSVLLDETVGGGKEGLNKYRIPVFEVGKEGRWC
jgi:hypothetical protein